jgi:hypothetical protein
MTRKQRLTAGLISQFALIGACVWLVYALLRP